MPPEQRRRFERVTHSFSDFNALSAELTHEGLQLNASLERTTGEKRRVPTEEFRRLVLVGRPDLAERLVGVLERAQEHVSQAAALETKGQRALRVLAVGMGRRKQLEGKQPELAEATNQLREALKEVRLLSRKPDFDSNSERMKEAARHFGHSLVFASQIRDLLFQHYLGNRFESFDRELQPSLLRLGEAIKAVRAERR